MNKNRILRLSDYILQKEASYTHTVVKRLERERDAVPEKPNTSEGGVVALMRLSLHIERKKAHLSEIRAEILVRKEAGTWNPKEPSRSMVKKDNPVITPKLQSEIDKADIEPTCDEPLEGKELPIKVFDEFGIRAWRLEDGPIHGEAPGDTIEDLSKTTSDED